MVDAEEENSSRLQLFSSPHSQMMMRMKQELLQSSPERAGMVTPLHTSAAASVPFRWEEHPGKPISPDDEDDRLLNFEPKKKKALDLPPRLLVMEEDPHSHRSKLQSSSFRVVKKDWQLGGSFRRTGSSLDGRVVSGIRTSSMDGKRSGGFFSNWKLLFKGNSGKEVGGSNCSHVFPSSVDGSNLLSYDEEEERCKEVKLVTASSTKISRSGSFSGATKSHHFWATIYEGLKQVVPWRGGKKNRDRGGLLS